MGRVVVSHWPSGFEVREAEANFKHELKLWGMSLMQIEQLAECDCSRPTQQQILTEMLEATTPESSTTKTNQR